MQNNRSYGYITVDAPGKIEVDGEIKWILTYTVGSMGMEKGGGIEIIFPPYQHQATREYVQVFDYWRPGYAWAICSDEDIKLSMSVEKIQTEFLHIKNWPDSSRVLKITTTQPLKEGQQIIVYYGGVDKMWVKGAAPPTRVGTLSHKKKGTYLEHKVHVDVKGKGEYIDIGGFPSIHIVPGKPSHIQVATPSIVKPNKEFPIKISMRDRFNNPIFDKPEEDLSIIIRNLKDKSIKETVEQIDHFTYKAILDKEGPYEIDIQCQGLDVEKSVVYCTEKIQELLWGDTHCHSNLTPNIRDNDGGADPEDCYEYARNISCLDFVCLVEQTFEFNDDETVNITPKTWAQMGRLSDKHYVPGEFVTYTGFEMHDKRGDTVVIFNGSLNDIPYPHQNVKEVKDVWNMYGKTGYMTIPHLHRYCGGRKTKDQQDLKYGGFNLNNWEEDNEYAERLVEIFSTQWGRFENNFHPMLLKARANIEGNTVLNFLNRGKCWGFTASSDDHDGRPGYGGITGVFTNSRTREGIFDGLYNRKSIASTNPKIIAFYTIDDHILGDVVRFSEVYKKPRQIKILAVTPKPMVSVELIKNGQVLYFKKDVAGQYIELEFDDVDPIMKNTYYYFRITQEDGHLAWASPIWFIKDSDTKSIYS